MPEESPATVTPPALALIAVTAYVPLTKVTPLLPASAVRVPIVLVRLSFVLLTVILPAVAEQSLCRQSHRQSVLLPVSEVTAASLSHRPTRSGRHGDVVFCQNAFSRVAIVIVPPAVTVTSPGAAVIGDRAVELHVVGRVNCYIT